jgi:hypothetical protein
LPTCVRYATRSRWATTNSRLGPITLAKSSSKRRTDRRCQACRYWPPTSGPARETCRNGRSGGGAWASSPQPTPACRLGPREPARRRWLELGPASAWHRRTLTTRSGSGRRSGAPPMGVWITEAALGPPRGELNRLPRTQRARCPERQKAQRRLRTGEMPASSPTPMRCRAPARGGIRRLAGIPLLAGTPARAGTRLRPTPPATGTITLASRKMHGPARSSPSRLRSSCRLRSRMRLVPPMPSGAIHSLPPGCGTASRRRPSPRGKTKPTRGNHR